MKTIIIAIIEKDNTVELQETLFSFGFEWNSQKHKEQKIKLFYNFNASYCFMIENSLIYTISSFSVSEYTRDYDYYESANIFIRKHKILKILKKNI